MNLRDLEYIVAVADLRSFSQAAEQCHVSQPTLSGQIKKLEEWLDVTLFERTNKRVLPTQTGEAIIQSARRILSEAETLHATAQNAHDPLSGTFRLGAFPTLSTYIFPDLVPKITESMPKLKLILIEEKTAMLIDQLNHGKLDAALLALPVHENYLETTELFQDPFYLATPATHPLAHTSTIDQSELHGQRLLLLDEGHCLRDQALAVCHLHQLEEEQDFRATGLETLRQMVKAGTGITFMPEIAIREPDTGIRYIPFSPPVPYRTIGLVWRKTSARTPVIEQLHTMLHTKNAETLA